MLTLVPFQFPFLIYNNSSVQKLVVVGYYIHGVTVMVLGKFCGEHSVSLVKYSRQEACSNELILLYCKIMLTESCKSEYFFPLRLYS